MCFLFLYATMQSIKAEGWQEHFNLLTAVQVSWIYVCLNESTLHIKFNSLPSWTKHNINNTSWQQSYYLTSEHKSIDPTAPLTVTEMSFRQRSQLITESVLINAASLQLQFYFSLFRGFQVSTAYCNSRVQRIVWHFWRWSCLFWYRKNATLISLHQIWGWS